MRIWHEGKNEIENWDLKLNKQIYQIRFYRAGSRKLSVVAFAIARYNLDFIDFCNFLDLSELNISQHERPHVVTESISI